MKTILSEVLQPYIEECSKEEIATMLLIPPNTEMGDYSFPCFNLAKTRKQSPKMIAEEIREEMLEDAQGKEMFEKIEVVKGYLNFYLKEEWYLAWLLEQSKHNQDPCKLGEGKTICIDYSSPNIAKNFHIGHLRTTFIGHSLYNIYRRLGYHVVGINHLGDWGTQFGKLTVAFEKWGDEKEVEEKGLDELVRLYVKFHDEEKTDEGLMAQARQAFVKMEEKDPEAIKLWNWFKDISMKEFNKIYDLLHISFDSYSGESFFMEQVPAVVEELQQKNLLKESEGANVVFLEEEALPPCLITKSDGSSIYPSRDIAAALYRKKTYDFSQCLYVTGLEQQLHFKQVFHVVKKMGYDWWNRMEHIPYGLVSFQGEKLATRTGNMVYAKDLLNEAIERVRAIIEEKNPNLSNKQEIASQVGIGAVIFHDLFNLRIKNVSFSWEQVLNFEGATGPYIQYTYARANSILKKQEDINWNLVAENMEYYKKESIKNLLKLLATFETVIVEAASRKEPCVIARYAYSLAQSFNQFYQECNIQAAKAGWKEAWLQITDLTQKTIQDAMALLGIECPKQM